MMNSYASRLAGIFLMMVCYHALAGDMDMKTAKEAESYAAGVNAARLYLVPGVDVNFDAFASGLKDEYLKKKLNFTEKQLTELMSSMQSDVKRKAMLGKVPSEQQGRQVESAFLSMNKSRYGVIETKSGLQYKVLRESTSSDRTPQDDDLVEFSYKTTTVKGVVLSENKTEAPLRLRVSELAPSLREGVKLMSEGSLWQFFVPSGHNSCAILAGDPIQPSKIMIYEITLHKIDSE